MGGNNGRDGVKVDACILHQGVMSTKLAMRPNRRSQPRAGRDVEERTRRIQLYIFQG